MINVSSMKIGDKLYRIDTQRNGLTRQKIEFTDADGNIWHRYDRPLIEFIVEEVVYVGKAELIVQGEIDPDIADQFSGPQYYFKFENDDIWELEPNEDWFLSRDEANEMIKIKKRLLPPSDK